MNIKIILVKPLKFFLNYQSKIIIMKFFKFSETISGGAFILRLLFSILLSIPFLVTLISFWTSYFMSLGDFDLADPSAENQAEIQSFAEELGAKIGENPEFYLNDMVSALTIGWIVAFILCIVPVIWFTLATYYKRIIAVFDEQGKNIFYIFVAYEIISDFIFLNFGFGSTIFSLISLIILIYLTFVNSKATEHNG